MESVRSFIASLRGGEPSICRHSRCLSAYSHLPTSSALWTRRQTLSVCLTAVWPILCTHGVYTGTCPLMNLGHSGHRVPRQPSFEILVSLFASVHKAIQLLQALGWVTIVQKSALQPSPGMLGPHCRCSPSRSFLPENKLVSKISCSDLKVLLKAKLFLSFWVEWSWIRTAVGLYCWLVKVIHPLYFIICLP